MLSQTESLVVGPDGEYIENIGVAVTKEYEPTINDVLSKNMDFKRAAIQYAAEQTTSTEDSTTEEGSTTEDPSSESSEESG